FESVIGGEKVGRYSFLAAEPFMELSSAELTGSDAENPLDVLRKKMDEFRVAHLKELPPFVGGAVGYAGYDTVRYVENVPNPPHDDRNLPDVAFAFYDHMIVFDNVQKTVIVVVLTKVGEEKGAKAQAQLKAAYDDACRRVDRFVAKLSTPTESLTPT